MTKQHIYAMIAILLFALVFTYIPYLWFLLFFIMFLGEKDNTLASAIASYIPFFRIDPALRAFREMKKNYLDSEIWLKKRNRRLFRDNLTCQSCGAKDEPLDVHHIAGYNEIPFEGIECLRSVCRRCHKFQHEVHGFPKTYEDYLKWDVSLVKFTEKW